MEETTFIPMKLPSMHSPIFPLMLVFVMALVSIEVSGCAGGAASEDVTESSQPETSVARDISDVELLALIAERPNLLLLDVRTDREWNAGHIEGACFLDFLEDDFPAKAQALPKDRPIAVYCAAGGRSADAMAFLTQHGFKEVYNLRDGFYGWEDAGRDVSNAPPVDLPSKE